jgi:predicted small metal-binding protein
MLQFACKDLGIDCGFVATGKSADEVMKSAMAHAGVVHKDMLKSMTKEQMDELQKTA